LTTSHSEIIDLAFENCGTGYFDGNHEYSPDAFIYKTTNDGLSLNQITCQRSSEFTMKAIEASGKSKLYAAGCSYPNPSNDNYREASVFVFGIGN
jgi:hypothetical protein